MKKYELVCIIHPDLDESAFNESIEKIRDWIKGVEGVVEETDIWGRRRLAYPIQKQREGQYCLITASLPPMSIIGLEQNLRFLEPLMRYMITVAK
ncbi:30S ribosomal protein S6 [Chloroflexota bacterium]